MLVKVLVLNLFTEKNNLFDKIAGKRLRFGIEKGAASAIGLYKLLYNYADKGNVLVLDDCDTVLYDETLQTCLKSHLTVAKNVRLVGTQIVLHYVTEGIPDIFEFKGPSYFYY